MLNRAWLWVAIAALLAPIVSAVVLLALAFTAFEVYVTAERHLEAGVDEDPAMESVWSWGHGKTKVARIPVRGVLMEEESSGLFAVRGVVETVLREIRVATEDPEIKAIILEIDSPGGGISACDLIHKALMDFKNTDPGRKIVALFGDVAASGAYYIATAADYVIAQPTTLTGSIGVLISALNVKGLGDQYGVRMVTVKSGANKDILNPFENLTEEQQNLLQGMVNEMQDRFEMLVRKGRPDLLEEDFQRITDGQIFTGAKALEYKLVDEVGYWDDAVLRTCELLGEKDVKVLRYSETFSLGSMLRGLQPVRLSPGNLAELTRARMMYMWQAW